MSPKCIPLRLALLAWVLIDPAPGRADVLIATNSAWTFRKATTEASTPADAWRRLVFDDRAWSGAPAPFHFGEAGIARGTPLPDMRNQYAGIFLRQPFVVSNLADVTSLTLQAASDDGFVAWINGIEVARYRVNPGSIAYTNLANSSAPEPVTFLDFAVTNYADALSHGTNLLAVQAMNRAKDNGDFQFNAGLVCTLRDPNPPVIRQIVPPPGPVGALTAIQITFSEPVQGIDETDLLINGAPAEEVSEAGATYIFRLRQPGLGAVRVAWAIGHQIADRAVPPNPFDSGAPGATWEYRLVDGAPPVLEYVHPPRGATVRALTEIVVRFSEPVTGLDARDLVVNGQAATNVVGIAAGPYRFEFPAAPDGPAQVAWIADHGLTDLAAPPNAFAGGTYDYRVDAAAAPPQIVINEVCAANVSGLADEDGDPEDWVELLNLGPAAANLEGWSLSDDPDQPGKWVFPSVPLGAGQFLVLFASGKDRRDPGPGERLHTNFKLADDGEYLGLYAAESPRVAASEVRLPNQRNDYSYGVRLGEWRYFKPPSPGVPNGASTITGAVSRVHFAPDRGLFDQPFTLTLTNDTAGASIRFTTDGSEPTETTGALYAGPIRMAATTVVRAAAFLSNHLPSRVTTHTYVFPGQIGAQPVNPPGFPVNWGSWKITAGDYAMDARIVNHAAYAPLLADGWPQLPSLSLVMPVADWFSPDRGIYSNGEKEGMAWERRGSAELLRPDGKEGFQINCGLRIQGGTSPDPWKSYKLSLRLNFRNDYGPPRLEYPLFPDSPVGTFDTLVLDAGLNYVWHYGGGVAPEEQRTRAKYVSDQFVSDLQSLSGTPGFHGRFMHLFLNGLYWGIYDVHEEPEAAFAADYYGGSEADYDVIKHTGSNVLDGNRAAWDAMMALARSGLAAPANYAALQQMLDVPSLIDYMLINFYVGNTDWPHHNWYALRQRTAGARWRFVSWDAEHVLKSVNENRTGVNNADSPAELYALLRDNSEFRLLFADRVQRHFFNGGLFYTAPGNAPWDPTHPERNVPAALYHRRVTEIDSAIVCESARWGDNQRPAQPYTRDVEWRNELNWLSNTYFPQRAAAVLGQLRSLGLYPSVVAPAFNQHGGYVARGFPLTLSAPAGALYYTLDGSDPRTPLTGAVAPGALRATTGVPVALTNTVLVRARVLSGTTWSALTEATFQVAELGVPLRPTEIMYHPPGGEAYEFIELQNTGRVPLDVSGLTFTGVQFTFPPSTVLAPGEVIVLASDAAPDLFASRYPGVPVFGTYGGALANNGEALALVATERGILWRLEYRDGSGWPAEADGGGCSLEVVVPEGDPSDPANWSKSDLPGGSPGQWSTPPPSEDVRLNEAFAAGAADWVELFNSTVQTVDLAGWSLSDGGSDRRFVFPSATPVAPGGFLVVHCDGQTNAPGLHAAFGLDSENESLFLHDHRGRRIDALSIGLQVPGFSIGRNPGGEWTLTEPTPAATNVPGALAPASELRINEWLANPGPGQDDWLELFNRSSTAPVALRGLHLALGLQLCRLQALSFLPPGGWVRLWADEQAGPNHLTFKLPAAGGSLVLLDELGAAIDRVLYPEQAEDVSSGRLPDGSTTILPLAALTPGLPNRNDPLASDRDGDTLPDVWEIAEGLDPHSGRGDDGAAGDPDQDAMPNASEFLAGTRPKDSGSRLEFATVAPVPKGVRLRFKSVANRAYRIEAAETVLPPEWRSVAAWDRTTADDTIEWIDRPSSSVPARFYRLVVSPPTR